MSSKLKLWMLERRKDLTPSNDPWNPWYDKAFSMVVCAATEADAREIAHEEAGDENHEIPTVPAPWKSSEHATCVELRPEGKAGLVIKDFHSA